MTSAVQDLKHGARLLLRSPGFSVVAIAALAIGIGANTAIFSVINTLLLQPLPYRDADRLAIVWEHNTVRDRKSNVVGPANFIHWREMNQVVRGPRRGHHYLQRHGDRERRARRAPGAVNLGRALPDPRRSTRRRPRLHRGRERPERPCRSSSAIVCGGADSAPTRRSSSEPFVSQGTPYTVVGVMPPGFSFLDKNVDVWLPIGFTAQSRTPRGRSLMVVGRLRPGISVRARAARHDAGVGAADADVPGLQHRLDVARRAAARAADRRRAAGAPRARRRRRLRAAHRVRERREPAAGAGDGAASGARRPRRARRRTRAAHPPAARRKRGPIAARRGLRAAARVVGAGVAARRGRRAAAHPASRDGRHRRAGSALHARRFARQRTHLRHRPRADGIGHEPHRRAQGRRALRARPRRGNRTRAAFVVVEIALALVLLVGAGCCCAASSGCSTRIPASIRRAR